MSIKVNISSYFQHYTNGVDVAEVSGTTVGECLRDLVKQFPSLDGEIFAEPGGLYDCIAVGVNRELFTAEEETLSRPVVDGDELSLLIIVISGG